MLGTKSKSQYTTTIVAVLIGVHWGPCFCVLVWESLNGAYLVFITQTQNLATSAFENDVFRLIFSFVPIYGAYNYFKRRKRGVIVFLFFWIFFTSVLIKAIFIYGA